MSRRPSSPACAHLFKLHERKDEKLIPAAALQVRVPFAPEFNERRETIDAWYRLQWLEQLRQHVAFALSEEMLTRETRSILRNEYEALGYALEMLKPNGNCP